MFSHWLPVCTSFKSFKRHTVLFITEKTQAQDFSFMFLKTLQRFYDKMRVHIPNHASVDSKYRRRSNLREQLPFWRMTFEKGARL